MTHQHRRDWGFFYWAAVGFLIGFGSVTAIGLPLVVIGLLLLVGGLFRGPSWPADLGLFAGVGSAALLLAAFAADEGGSLPTASAAVGLGLVALGAGGFWWLRCRPGLS